MVMGKCVLVSGGILGLHTFQSTVGVYFISLLCQEGASGGLQTAHTLHTRCLRSRTWFVEQIYSILVRP